MGVFMSNREKYIISIKCKIEITFPDISSITCIIKDYLSNQDIMLKYGIILKGRVSISGKDNAFNELVMEINSKHIQEQHIEEICKLIDDSNDNLTTSYTKNKLGGKV